jgi:hypothetical protein
MNTLPTDSAARKEYPIVTGCLDFFPAAIAGVARHSHINAQKHGGGVFHHRGASMDHCDCLLRHLIDLRGVLRGVLDERLVTPGLHEERILNEANALAWRALAISQELHEALGEAPLAPGARL